MTTGNIAIPAHYDGTCWYCGDPITTHDMIVIVDKQVWVHEHCADAIDAGDRPDLHGGELTNDGQ